MITQREILWGIGSLLIVAFITHRLALSRKRRLEYNALADKMFLNVDRTVMEADGHSFSINRSDIAIIRRRMGWLKRRAFDRAIAEYEKAANNTYQDDCGQVHFRTPDDVNKALAYIAKCLKHK